MNEFPTNPLPVNESLRVWILIRTHSGEVYGPHFYTSQPLAELTQNNLLHRGIETTVLELNRR